MKNIKKVFALLLAAALLLSLCAAAVAESITITGSAIRKGETYTVYNLLHCTTAGSDAYSYYLTSAEYDADTDGTPKTGGLGKILTDAGFTFEKSADGTRYTVKNDQETVATLTAGINDMIASLKGNVTLLDAKALDKRTATATEDGQVTFEELPMGYYFVASTLGAVCELRTGTDAIVMEKNAAPQVDKMQSASADGTYGDAILNLSMGDTVYYEIAVTDGTGTDQAITLTDVLSSGLTLDTDSIQVVTKSTDAATSAVTETAVAAGKYSVTGASASGFTLTLTAAYVAELDANQEVYIKYSAAVNENAGVDSNTANSNTVTMTYSQQTFTDATYIATYDVLVKKVAKGTQTFLDGAEFKLYNAATGGNQILLKKDGTGYYRAPDGDADTTIDINSAAGENIRGLAPGTYYLEEVVVPDGYNPLTARKDFTINADNANNVELIVENSSGVILPATGGIGTTIFYIAGVSLALGAAIVLVARRKAEHSDHEK